MALRMRDRLGEFQDQLERLHNENYYYVGEYVFAGSHREQNKICKDDFPLWDVPHGDELDRIVMLFADLSVKNAVILIIEGSRVIRTGSESSRFLIDTFHTMGHSVPAKAVGDMDPDGITQPVRLIYPKPLFLTFLYRWNLLVEGHNAHALIDTDTEELTVRKWEDQQVIERIQTELQNYYDFGLWDAMDFKDHNPDHGPSTKRICELANYLDGLNVFRDAFISGKEDENDDAPGRFGWHRRCQQIDNMIRAVKHQLRKLEPSARMEVPFADPAKSAALWRLEEAFPKNMSFGEMVSIRAYLEQDLFVLKRSEPCQDILPKRHALWERRLGLLSKQICQMEALLGDEMGEHALDWEDYLA